MPHWRNYTDGLTRPHTVLGDLRVHDALYSPQLGNRRDVLVWLPYEYDSHPDRHYPVLYMHDGDNLFDGYASYSGEWRVDEALTTLRHDGLEAIVVGLPNAGNLRRVEYNPYPAQLGAVFWDGRGADYIAFITDTVKPLIDSSFRTHPTPATTGIAGSSMGGLISLYGFLTRPDVFGLCGAFSPVPWIGEAETGLLPTLRQVGRATGKVYLDIGGREGEVILGIAPHLTQDPAEADRMYLDGVRHLRDGLLSAGYRLGQTLHYLEDPEAKHNEGAWAARLPTALRYLLSPSGA